MLANVLVILAGLVTYIYFRNHSFFGFGQRAQVACPYNVIMYEWDITRASKFILRRYNNHVK